MATIISHERIVWSTCGVGLFRQKIWNEGSKRHTLDQNWKNSKPGAWTSGFTNGAKLIEAYRFKLLKSLMKIGKTWLICIIL